MLLSTKVRPKNGSSNEGALIGRDEMNLAEFPFALLSKAQGKQKTVEFTDMVTAKDGKPVTRQWVVTGADKYGLPVRDDEAVYVALMQVAHEEGFTSQRVAFTKYRLLKIIGWPIHHGAYTKKVEESLHRLAGVYINAKRSFWDHVKREYETVGFHIIDDFRFGPEGYFKWNDVIWKSIQRGYIKRLDTAFWFSLKSPVGRRLYRYLDKKFHQDNVFAINVKKLAFEHLGLSRSYDAAQIRRLLKPGLDELVSHEYLKGYSYERRQDGECLIFTRTAGAERQLSLSIAEEPDGEEGSALVSSLTSRGVTEKIARRLVLQHTPERIHHKIELFDYLRQTKSPNLGKNPGGYLRKAIEEDYAAPEGFKTRAEREGQAQKHQEQRRRQDRAEKVREFEDWLRASDEQKVKGPLFLWQTRFRREHRRPATAEETEAMRKDLFQSLPTASQRWVQLFPGEPYPKEEYEASEAR